MTNICIVHVGKKLKRCGNCEGCLSTDCGQCIYCLDKMKFWWPTCAKAELSEMKVHTANILWFVVGVLIHAAFMNMLYLSIGSVGFSLSTNTTIEVSKINIA